MRVSSLTALGFYLNGALGSGHHNDVSIAEVKAHIRARTIFQYLDDLLGDDVDLSGLTEEYRAELNEEWIALADDVDEARKMCVDRNGLCLLVAYLLEGIQRRAGR